MRIGAVAYLNSKPLILGLEHEPGVRLSLDLPSRLADGMARGALDAGLIPVAEYLRALDYRFVPGIGISSHGPVHSVLLHSRVPLPNIRSVAMDEGSRTSAALCLILLAKRQRLEPDVRPLPIDQPAAEADADAVLLIGDRAMHAPPPGFSVTWDLGEQWHHWTRRPMVFALWALRPEADAAFAARVLHAAKQRGTAQAAAIARSEAERLRLEPDHCVDYLTRIIRYDLGDEELAGLRLFHRHAADLGLVPAELPHESHRHNPAPCH